MEALILYFVLFFPGVYSVSSAGSAAPAEIIPFSPLREIARALTYSVPSLALLWYLISGGNGFSALREEKPRKKDILAFGIGFPGLVVAGVVISLLASFITASAGLSLPPKPGAPSSAPGWIVLALSCLCTGYLEESYFRYYLLTTDRIPGHTGTVSRIAFSTVLFAICHIYEGFGGVANAALAGVLLSVLFTRYRTLHGIAWAHGVYNIFVYITGRLYEIP